MPLDLSIPATGTLMLFVEDAVTRDYLRTVREEPIDVVFRLGGGNDGVQAIVKAFEEEGHPNVFGLIDRDFRPSNRERWLDSAKTFRTFVLPNHEIENSLLDAEALLASPYQNRGLDAPAIEAKMRRKAGHLCWWAACRETIAELKRRFREPFVPDPTQAIVDEASARAHVCDSDWFKKLPGEAARSTEAEVHRRLAADHDAAADRLLDGTWRREFAGKEILKDVAGWMCDRTKIADFPRRDADFYADLAKGIAAWQVENEKVPGDIAELWTALRARIARPPGTP